MLLSRMIAIIDEWALNALRTSVGLTDNAQTSGVVDMSPLVAEARDAIVSQLRTIYA